MSNIVRSNTTDSNENESYSSDENNEYTEPTCNNLDPNVGVEYDLFDNYNETRPFDKLIKARPF